MASSPFGNYGFGGAPFGASSGIGGMPFGTQSAVGTAPLSFSDPALSASFHDPLLASDYAAFSSHDIPGEEGSSLSSYITLNNRLVNQEAPNRFYTEEEEGPPWQPRTRKNYLTDRQTRTYNALANPTQAAFFDLQAHPEYSRLRQEWYADSPTDNFLKYFPRASNLMSSLDNQHKVTSSRYLSPDFFAHSLYKQSPPNGLPGPIERANTIRKAWEKQPLLAHKNLDLSGQRIGGAGNWDWQNAINAERPYINEEFEEAASDDGFGGFLGGLIRVAAPVLSFIPGLQPLGIALGAMNSLANNNPLGALLSLGGAALGGAFSGGEALGGFGEGYLGDLAASDFANFGMEGVGALGNSLGYSAGIDWAPLSSLSGGTPSALAGIGGTDFSPGYLSDLAASDFANFGVQGVDALGNSLGYSAGVDYSAPTAEGFALPEGASKALGRGAIRGALRALQPQQKMQSNVQQQRKEQERRRRRRLQPGTMGNI